MATRSLEGEQICEDIFLNWEHRQMFCNVLLFWFGGRLFIIRVRTKANASLPRLHHNYCFASRHLYDIRKQRGEKILLIGWWETPEVSKHKMCRDRVLLVFSHWVFTLINLSTAAPAASHSGVMQRAGPWILMLNVTKMGVSRDFSSNTTRYNPSQC